MVAIPFYYHIINCFHSAYQITNHITVYCIYFHALPYIIIILPLLILIILNYFSNHRIHELGLTYI
jgi:hypothetical protein